MSEDSDQEKTEEPTSKRLDDAQKKGQIARSRELNTFVMLVTSATLFLMMGSQIGHGLITMMRSQFQLSRAILFDAHSPIVYFKQVLVDGVMLIMPFMSIMVVAAIAAPLALGGWIFSLESLAPQLDRLDPIKGIPRLFAVRGLIEMIKALLKFLLVFSVAFVLCKNILRELIGLGAEPLEQSIPHGLSLNSMSFMVLSVSLIIVVMFDVPYQLWDHSKKLKMTLQEIKDEMKESEGRPEVKAHQRRVRMEMAQNQMMTQVPKADVIVTNPTHYAIALKYDQDSNSAPRIIAKGVDLMAAQIRLLATNANVPLVASPPLARALYYSTDIDREIPKELFLAVAQVLAYIYQLKIAQENHWEEPLPPENIKIPDDFKQSR